MPSETTWYLSLDRQRLQKAYAADGHPELINYEVDSLFPGATTAVDVVAGVTEQSVCVYFALSHTWGHLDESSHSPLTTYTQHGHRTEFSHHFTPRHSRPVRCHASELRQCITWLVFQTLEDIASIPLAQQFNTNLHPPGEECHREVEHALRICRPSLIQYFLKALYFAAAAVRLLNPEELFDVVQVALAETRQFQTACDLETPQSPDELLRLVSLLLVVNTMGNVQFRSASLRDFLLGSRFLERENGDEYMARTCLQYLSEDDESPILKPWCGFCKKSQSARRRPFFKYAYSHWHRHYRSAENESNNLAAQLHQRIERDVTSLWGRQGLLHIDLQNLCLEMGFAVCTYYGFQFLMGIYQQMGASYCNTTKVLMPFPRPMGHSLLFSEARMTGFATTETALDYRTLGKICEVTPVPLVADASWAETLTDGESSLEESWASLPARSQSEQWISDFDDLRLELDEHVFVHQRTAKGFEDGWEVIDRKPGLGS